MRKKTKTSFSFTLDREKIRQSYRLSPEMKLTWLEEANHFINKTLSKEKRMTWGKLQKSHFR